jgi:hypothetical protein
VVFFYHLPIYRAAYQQLVFPLYVPPVYQIRFVIEKFFLTIIATGTQSSAKMAFFLHGAYFFGA